MNHEDKTPAQLSDEVRALKREIEFHRDIYESSPELQVSVDAENERVKRCNQTLCDRLGYRKEEVIGSSVFDLYHPDCQADARQVMSFAKTGRVRDTRLELKHKAGNKIPVVLNAAAVKNENGKILERRSVWRDISDQVAAEQKARQSERLFRNVFEQAAVGIARVGPSGTWLDVNRRFCDLVGYSHHELLARTFQDITHPEDLDADLDKVRLMLAGDIQNYAIERRFLKKDGSVVWTNLTVALVRDKDGEPDFFISVAEDISARVKSQAALRKSEARYREVVAQRTAELEASEERYKEVFEASQDGILVAETTSQRFVLANPQMERITGHTRADLIGMSLDRIHPAQALPRVREAFAQQANGASPLAKDIPVLRKDGTVVFCDINATPQDFGGKKCLVGVFRDVTERRRAENSRARYQQQLEAANQELEAFAYSISHDLRAPLRAIDGFSKALLEDYAEQIDATGQDFLQRVRAGAQRMGKLIDGLLQISYLSRVGLACAEVDLSAMARSIFEELQAADPERQVATIVAPALLASGDPTLLHTALQNLLSNAWKFTGGRSRGRIEVGFTAAPETAAFFVRDNGAGFDMAYADKLFGVFQRLHDTTEFPGTGVGLATVQRVIHRHGGRIWGEAAVNQGATFFFTLPHANGTGVSQNGS